MIVRIDRIDNYNILTALGEAALNPPRKLQLQLPMFFQIFNIHVADKIIITRRFWAIITAVATPVLGIKDASIFTLVVPLSGGFYKD